MTRITDTEMTCESGRHHANPVRVGDPYGPWEVSWLPGRELTRNQAITAMVLTDYVEHSVEHSPAELEGRRWAFVEGWAAELRLTGQDAVGKIRGVRS
jgi:hypothetical protein